MNKKISLLFSLIVVVYVYCYIYSHTAITFNLIPSSITHKISVPTRRKRYAYYVFLQSDGKPEYFAEAATLVHDLKELGNRYPINIILSSGPSKDIKGIQKCLLALGANKVSIQPAIQLHGLPEQYAKQYTKVLLWNKMEFDTILLMDTEILLMPNHKMDDIFKLTENMFTEGKKVLGVDHGKCGRQSKHLISLGFTLLKPNSTLFEEIVVDLLNSITCNGTMKTEQNFLHEFFEKRNQIGFLDYGWDALEWYHDSWKIFGKENYFWNGDDTPPARLYSIQEKKSLFPQKSIRQYYQSRWDLAKESLKNNNVTHLCPRLYNSHLR